MNGAISAREAALKALNKIETDEGYSNLVLDELLAGKSINELDKALVTELVYGVTSQKLALDYIINRNSKIKPNKISPWIRNILRMGLYQILFLTKIPTSAACNESVKLARRYGHQASAGFVNAMLRKIADSSNPLEAIEEKDAVDRLSIVHSHPVWLVEMWIDQLGLTFTEDICKANNERPHIAIRVNRLKTDKDKLKQLLLDKGLEFSESCISSDGLILKRGNPISQMYEKGLYTVQDEAAMLVSEILDPKPGEIVADVCSAPGGKTTHIAQLMENEGRIYAWDIHQNRLELVEKAAHRLDVKIIETKKQDAAELDKSLIGKCDKVLVDAPCSGLGVIRRKPEIKWTRNIEDLAALSELQHKILETASKYLKQGGRLVYSTCTINKDENENVVEDFLGKNRNFVLESISVKAYDIIDRCKDEKYLHLYPNIHETDGFFIASLTKDLL